MLVLDELSVMNDVTENGSQKRQLIQDLRVRDRMRAPP